MIRVVEILCFEFLNMITAWCWTKEQEISDQFWEHFKYNLLIFCPVLFFLCFFDSICCLTTKKRIAIKNLETSYHDRQTSAKSRILIFKFKDYFFPSFWWQFFFLPFWTKMNSLKTSHPWKMPFQKKLILANVLKILRFCENSADLRLV
jgi:hypothetical protein